MALRNWVFNTFQKVTESRAGIKLDHLIAINRNEQFVKQGDVYKKYAELGRQFQNNERILMSQMDDLQKQKYEILRRYNQEGLTNDDVDVEAVSLQVDRINFLQRLKLMEDNPSVYDKEEVEFYRLLGKVHLEEENAQSNLDQYLVKKPWMRKYTILSHI